MISCDWKSYDLLTFFPHAFGPCFIISKELHPWSEKTFMAMFCRFDLRRTKKRFTRAMDALARREGTLFFTTVVRLVAAGPNGAVAVAFSSVSNAARISGATLAPNIFFLTYNNLFDFMFDTGIQAVSAWYWSCMQVGSY